MRILVADDDTKDEATWLAQTHTYDVMVFDVMMPGKDGFTVVRQLRKKNIMTPVIFVTARGEVEDRVRGLDAGGDDYLVKPFSLTELQARLRAILRRQRAQPTNVLRVGDLLIVQSALVHVNDTLFRKGPWATRSERLW